MIVPPQQPTAGYAHPSAYYQPAGQPGYGQPPPGQLHVHLQPYYLSHPQPQANVIVVTNPQQQHQQTVDVDEDTSMCGTCGPTDEECSCLCTLKWIGIVLLLLIVLPIFLAFCIIWCALKHDND